MSAFSKPALHYQLEQISKSEILRKLNQRFAGKIISDNPLSRWLKR